MAQANLALALEQAGEPVRARFAARQAVAMPTAAEPVRAQATAVLERLGGGPGDVLTLLDGEPSGRRPAIVREELARWVELPDGERRAEAGAWIDGQLARDDTGSELAAVWVGALLELPPAALREVIAATVDALGERDRPARELFRSEVGSAAARFHVPQLMRLRDAFNQIAAERGQEAEWR